MGKTVDVSMLVQPRLMYKLVIVGLILASVDLALTIIGLRLGLMEANPISTFSVLFLAFKFGIWLILLPLIYFSNRKKSAFGLFTVSLTSIIGVCIYAFIVTLNFTLILGAIT